MTPAGATKPAQAECQLCHRLFCYFVVTKRRMYCGPCSDIERRAAQVFFNEVQRRQRLEARENARMAHA